MIFKPQVQSTNPIIIFLVGKQKKKKKARNCNNNNLDRKYGGSSTFEPSREKNKNDLNIGKGGDTKTVA